MKVRKGFVSNSSSASFIVEVKGKKENIFRALYENIESFKEENYKELLENALKWEEGKLTRELSVNEKDRVEYNIGEYRVTLKKLEEYVKPDWDEIKKSVDPDKKEFATWKEKRHIEDVVEGIVSLKHWNCAGIDDGYISFADSTIIYNGWEDISIEKF